MTEKKLNRIREVLREQGRTNKWLAEQLDKNEVTISRWCRNVQQPDLETLYKAAELLDVQVSTLLVDIPPDNIKEGD
jgi:putative transcriptional regulator